MEDFYRLVIRRQRLRARAWACRRTGLRLAPGRTHTRSGVDRLARVLERPSVIEAPATLPTIGLRSLRPRSMLRCASAALCDLYWWEVGGTLPCGVRSLTRRLLSVGGDSVLPFGPPRRNVDARTACILRVESLGGIAPHPR